jgi:hypothetical protein
MAMGETKKTAKAHHRVNRHLLDQQMVNLANGLITNPIDIRSMDSLDMSRRSGCAVAFVMANL